MAWAGIVARCALLAVLLLVCDEAPLPAPGISGTGQGQPGDTLWFVAVVPRRVGTVSFRFDWGDGSQSGWSPQLPSGEAFRHWHVFAGPGGYEVRAQLADGRDGESEWSDPLPVVVAFAGPLVPERPAGPERAFVDTGYTFTTAAGHVRGESVACEFAWSDSLTIRSAFVPAGAPASIVRSFVRPGRRTLRVRALDAAGNASPWSDTAVIDVVPWPLAAPCSLELSAYAGVYVRLRWNRGRNSDSVRYGIWFRRSGMTGFVMVDAVSGQSFIHDPAGSTGEYLVSARGSGLEIFSAETLSTLPIYTDTLVVGELNTTLNAGVGWDSQTGLARPVSMRDSGGMARADLYFTDFTPGWLGPTYYLASAARGPLDPGGVVPQGAWRATGLLGLFGGHEPLPQYDSLLYQSAVDVSAFVSYCAAYTSDGYYALVKSLGPNTIDGTLKVVTWFQRVRGLRLIGTSDERR